MKKQYQLLAVDDDSHDLEVLKKVVDPIDWLLPLRTVESGESAIEQLSGVDMVLLDVNLSGIDGKETLRRIREKSRSLVVIMLSTSSYEKDIKECYELGANAYLVKPFQIDVLRQMIETTSRYWLEIVVLPPIY